MASRGQSYRAGEAKGQTEEKANQMMDATLMMESLGEKAQATKDKTYQAAQTTKEKIKGATQATTHKAQEKVGAAKDKAWGEQRGK
ncbi:late embryogenesis abundant protein 2-like [Argentina anserina]|uniref:late embryogenesis abundant protein 2-like n=1 Tax=Argentina anserina TaxID=57926 RepID=UPI0021764C0E|nr:late embryogenesis abundant protein 2-like [Potentilla anserina]